MSQPTMTARSSSDREQLEVLLAAALEENEQLKAVIAAQARELEALLDEHSRPTERQLSIDRIEVWEGHQ